jgi:hypothetical protein
MAGRRHYCTYFDHRYLARGLAMIRSLRRFEPDATIWVLCLSEPAEAALLALEPGLHTIGLAEFVAADPELQAARANRSLVEFYFTCTPSIICHVLSQAGPEDIVTYVDGDLYFFDSPEPLFDELEGGSVSIIPHRFSDAHRDHQRVGIYNVGWLGFRNDARGREVAGWWRARCNEWCYDIFEPDRFLDQKYLDRFPAFDGVVVIGHPGANLGPWNVVMHSLSLQNGAVTVDGAPLIFFHFHGLKSLGRSIFFAPHDYYDSRITPLIREHIYRPYLETLTALDDQVERFIGAIETQPLRTPGRSLLVSLKNRLQLIKRYVTLIAKGQAIRIRPR